MNIVRAFLAVIATIGSGCATVEEAEEAEEEAAIWDAEAEAISAEDLDAEIAIAACIAAGLCGSEEQLPKKPPKTPLQVCTAACDAGQEAMQAFCRALPNPLLKAGCWAASYGTTIACKNWCAWNFT